jgi:hypothetical protein
MKRSFERYQHVGARLVHGWLEPQVFTVMRVLDKAQRAQSVRGSAAEIGVHHGKLLIALHLLRAPEERTVAIDLFENQQLNIDKSGRGDFAKLVSNLKRWTDNSGIVFHRGDSTELSGADVKSMAGAAVRMFSVDGGHTEKTVQKDMETAEGALADGGIVIADDVFNPQWPGVVAGTFRYLDGGGALIPFAVGFNKVFFTTADHALHYRLAIRDAFRNRFGIEHKASSMLGHEVEVLFAIPRTPRRILSRNQRARALYRSIRGR